MQATDIERNFTVYLPEKRVVLFGLIEQTRSENVRDQKEQHQQPDRHAEQPGDQVFAHVVVLVAATPWAPRRLH
ncbi:hypothetical protein [Burkholderia lata]|uniref:hypothetical protein n=1 Tax=Burkholderia lata (strain ATCC 17760 / DSM 23089 / LMG 22485 / NCIMB 9086 / R18194 / 383) TaxID=482957 RepID=UPI001427DB89|nr:hypothetical protein [Burkholderia lata]